MAMCVSWLTKLIIISVFAYGDLSTASGRATAQPTVGEATAADVCQSNAEFEKAKSKKRKRSNGASTRHPSLQMHGSKKDEMEKLRLHLSSQFSVTGRDGYIMSTDTAVVHILWGYAEYYETLNDDGITAIGNMNTAARTFASGTMSYKNQLDLSHSKLSEISTFYRLDLIAEQAGVKYTGFTSAAVLSHYHKDLLGQDLSKPGKNNYISIDDTSRYSGALHASMAKCAFGKMTMERANLGRGLTKDERDQVRAEVMLLDPHFVEFRKFTYLFAFRLTR